MVVFLNDDFNISILMCMMKIPQVESHILEGHGDEVWSLCFSPDGKMLATASADGRHCYCVGNCCLPSSAIKMSHT